MLESIQPYIGVLGCVLAVILLVYCIILHIRLGSLTKKFNFFMQGENGASLERKLSVEITEIREAAKGLQDMIEEQTQIRNIQGNTLQKSALRSIMHLITSATICPFPLHCLMAIIMGFAFPVSMAEMTLVFSVNQL